MRDGVWSRLANGIRRVERDATGRPAQITISGTDELGRTVAVGIVASRQVFKCYPSMFCWNSLVEWDLDGHACWGEDQDIWHPEKWRGMSLDRKHRRRMLHEVRGGSAAMQPKAYGSTWPRVRTRSDLSRSGWRSI